MGDVSPIVESQDVGNKDVFASMAYIRAFEQNLLQLFSEGKLNGTTHTCIGQESVAVSVMTALDREKDCVFSNHRGHGHFLSYGGPPDSLLSEIMGKQGALCASIGGSQHLHHRNFYSNGIQGGIVPVTCGIAWAEKLKGSGAIAVCFLGDGTFGEGVVYESLNIASVMRLPVLFVVEDNHIAQSTPAELTLSGSFEKRAQAFDVKCQTIQIVDVVEAVNRTKVVVSEVRSQSKPQMIVFDTQRLMAHSKGDDTRPAEEVDKLRLRDPYEKLKDRMGEDAMELEAKAQSMLTNLVADVEARPLIDQYNIERSAILESKQAKSLLYAGETGVSQVKVLNAALHQVMADKSVVFFGEDVIDDYGGAFKVSKGLSTSFPDRVHNMPISEASIVGLANGLSLRGMKPIGEIMFGDFLTLGFDQLLNHAAKFHLMYGREINLPLVIRTPMGGRRGYGPTHSQCIEKHLLGINGLGVIALNLRHDPALVLDCMLNRASHPSILLEYKVDYGRAVCPELPLGYQLREIAVDCLYPSLHLSPESQSPMVTIVSYGGMLTEIESAIEKLQIEDEIEADVFYVTELNSPPVNDIVLSVNRTGRLVTVEEGSAGANFGAEIIALVAEQMRNHSIIVKRLNSNSQPIPSNKKLEEQHLISAERIYQICLEIV